MSWSLRGRVALMAMALASAVGALLSVGCEDGPSLQTEQFTTRDGEPEEQVGRACIPVKKGSGMGGGRAPGVPGAAGEGDTVASTSGYSFSYEGTGSGVRLTVADKRGKTLAERNYDAAFIAAGRKDELEVATPGETLRFVGRGVAACGD
jgi:hypothetical protein